MHQNDLRVVERAKITFIHTQHDNHAGIPCGFRDHISYRAWDDNGALIEFQMLAPKPEGWLDKGKIG